MDLLPKSHTHFAEAAYWDDFFKKRGTKAFEWYGEYAQLSPVLRTYIKTSDSILITGCGNSRLGEDLYDVSHTNITSVDINDGVIKTMQARNAADRPLMKFACMDVTKMTYEDDQFSVVLDKGTLDALMPDASSDSLATAGNVLSEALRVLRPTGRYICVTLAQQHIIEELLNFCCRRTCIVRVHRGADNYAKTADWKMPVFVVVVTKLKPVPGFRAVLESAFFDGKTVRYADATGLKVAIRELQRYAYVQCKLSKNECQEEVSVDLYSSESELPRYSLHVLDSGKVMKGKFAVFIVPQGREAEWLFATMEGRQQLLATAGHRRLAIAALSHAHSYPGGMEQVKAELSARVMELAPTSLPSDAQVPFLSVGEGIGHRTVIHRSTSALSGAFYVEDVEVNSRLSLRQLVFESNLNLVQTKYKLQIRKQGKPRIDKRQLMSPYHVHFVAALSLLRVAADVFGEQLKVLIIGLGGGALPSFLHSSFPKMVIEVVEIDPVMVDVAKEWFNIAAADDRLTLTVADGLEYVRICATTGRLYDCIMVDVDSKDKTTGMSCPPAPFVEDSFLSQLRDLLKPGGLTIMNVSCRQAQLRQLVLTTLRTIFGHASSLRALEDVNETVIAARHPLKFDSKSIEFAEKLQRLAFGAQASGSAKTDLVDVLRTLKLC